MVNPDDFVIKRRRKKYKFAHFANLANCFEADEFKLVSGNRPVTLEVGAGSGSFSLELARRHPDRFFVALDAKADRLQAGAQLADSEELGNIVFVRAHANQLPDILASASLEAVWLTFSDPFPKKRHIKNRLTHPSFLEHYRLLLAPSGHVLLKHDNTEFFNWSLEQLVGLGWRLNELSFDLHESTLEADYKILTNYEIRWLDEGLVTKFVKAYPPVAGD